jgi:RNA polymerase sigma-32 factor
MIWYSEISQEDSMNYPAVEDDFTQFLSECRKIKPLTREREYELAVRYHETGDPQAAQELVICHLPFVVRVALRYRHYHLPMLDLVHEGVIGFIKAVKRFDPFKGYRLATFAIWWVKAYIQNFIIRCWRLVKLGTTQTQRRLFYHLKRLKGQTESTVDDQDLRSLAIDLDVKEDEVIEMEARLNATDLSLHAPLADNKELNFMDVLPDPMPNPEEVLAADQMSSEASRKIFNAINVLDLREKFVIRKRYLDESPWTLAQIGRHFSITRERARQLEQRALKKLRAALQEPTDKALLN